jgi:hypothetical protein
LPIFEHGEHQPFDVPEHRGITQRALAVRRFVDARDVSQSIAAEAAGRLDADEVVEIEIDDGLQGGAGGGVTQIVRQDVIPGGIFGLQGDKPGDRVTPALCAGAPVGWPPVANHRRWLLGLAARAVTRLAFGVAERVLTFGLSASGHGLSTVM